MFKKLLVIGIIVVLAMIVWAKKSEVVRSLSSRQFYKSKNVAKKDKNAQIINVPYHYCPNITSSLTMGYEF